MLPRPNPKKVGEVYEVTLDSTIVDRFSEDAANAGFENEREPDLIQEKGAIVTLVFPRIRDGNELTEFCRKWICA